MTRAASPRRRQRGTIDTLPSGALRVRVYAGIDPLTKRRHDLVETIPPGPGAALDAEKARTRLLNQVDERRNPRTRATVSQLLDRWLDVLIVPGRGGRERREADWRVWGGSASDPSWPALTMGSMSAEAVGMHMPAVVTLDDVAAMNAADPNGHRYETSPEAVLSVMPPPDSEHAMIASRLFAWLIIAGWPAEQVLQAVGVRIPGRDGDGGRIPDVSVWRKPPPRGVWSAVADLVLVVEIVSPGSEAMDLMTKVREYARAGIPQYWVVDRDGAHTVTLHRLAADGAYEEKARMPMAWLLQTSPSDHID